MIKPTEYKIKREQFIKESREEAKREYQENLKQNRLQIQILREKIDRAIKIGMNSASVIMEHYNESFQDLMNLLTAYENNGFYCCGSSTPGESNAGVTVYIYLDKKERDRKVSQYKRWSRGHYNMESYFWPTGRTKAGVNTGWFGYLKSVRSNWK